mmetsp:Transcript_35164/g.76086  ORF Transcript_35164/g.76086 Transcript_35164/m.76086 type:complete len:151 (-) Transcript_35164:49-501(-)
MSWIAWAERMYTGAGTGASIYGVDGTLWGHAGAECQLDPDAVRLVLDSYTLDSGPQPEVDFTTALPRQGLRINHENFIFTRGFERTMYLRKGSDGAHISRTRKFLAVVMHDEAFQAQECTSHAENVVDQLCEALGELTEDQGGALTKAAK